MRELERHSNRHNDPPSLTIVGPGRLGRALAQSGSAAGLDVTLADRGDALAAAELSEAVLLCVPDEAISEACRSIAAAVGPVRFVGHSSGATTLDALAAATARGARAFSLHPLQTVPDGAASIAGAPCAVAGSDPKALAVASRLAESLGMRPFEVPESARAAYHAAACIASNFLVALEESAAELFERAGIADGRELLAPLVLRSAANWAERGPSALTGPIARGDEATIDRHLDALAEDFPELLGLYDALAQRTRAIAEKDAAAA